MYLFAECGRQKILAFVYGSKDVVLSTGRAIGRVVLGSQPTNVPEDVESLANRLNVLFAKPSHIRNMLQIIQILSETNLTDKQELIRLGLMSQLIKEIDLCCQQGRLSTFNPPITEQRRGRWSKRPSTATSHASKGVGYGTGSTKSRWDIERAAEQKVAQEERMMWLSCALTTFICGDSLKLSEVNPELVPPKEHLTLPNEIVEELVNSGLIAMLEYSFNNDSIFDISQRMDLYQVGRNSGINLFCDFSL